MRNTLIMLVPLLVAVGCGPEHHLDAVSRELDKWGTLSISGATLIEPDPKFQFDLELTGREILNWNRTEGFSNLSQIDAFDAQVSIRAEIISGLLNQMSATTEPKLLEKLQRELQSAAFQTLLDALPGDAADRLAGVGEILKPDVSQPPAGGTGASGSAGAPVASDFGLASIEAAERAVSDAQKALSELRDAASRHKTLSEQIEKNETEIRNANPPLPTDHPLRAATDGLKAKRDAEQTTASGRLDAAWAAISSAADAVIASADPMDAVLQKAQAQFASLPADAKAAAASQASLFADTATRINKLRTDGRALKVKIEAARSKSRVLLTDAATVTAAADDVNKLISGAESPTVNGLTVEARAVSAQVRTVAAVHGVEVVAPATKQEPKILEAEAIDPSRRLALKRLTPFRPPLANPTQALSLNLRQLLLLSASDKMTLEMLRWLSYPRDNAPNKRIYVCMSSVNIVPGRMTYRGYNGTIDLRMEYARVNACGILERQLGASPTTFAVFPFIDSQVLDLRTSRREAVTLAAQLALTGYPVAANALLDYARQREQDAATLTGLNTVTSYSDGNHVGFTFSPRFVAQGDPSDLNSAPLMNLQPQTIPVMVMIVCELQYQQSTNGPTIASIGGHNGVSALLDSNDPPPKMGGDGATHLLWSQSYRWTRAPNPSADRWPGGRAMDQLITERMKETDFMDRARNLDAARNILRGWNGKAAIDPTTSAAEKHTDILAEHGWEVAKPATYQEQHLRSRLGYLASAAIGSNIVLALPQFPAGDHCATGKPEITIHPPTGWLDQPNTFFLHANGDFFSGGFAVSVGGRSVNATRISPSVAKIVMPPWNEISPASAASLDKAVTVPVAVTNSTYTIDLKDPVRFVYQSRPVVPLPATSDGKEPLRVSLAKEVVTINLASELDDDRVLRIDLSRKVDARDATIAIQYTHFKGAELVIAESRIKARIVDGKRVESAAALSRVLSLAASQPATQPPDLRTIAAANITGLRLLLPTEEGELSMPVRGVLRLEAPK